MSLVVEFVTSYGGQEVRRVGEVLGVQAQTRMNANNTDRRSTGNTELVVVEEGQDPRFPHKVPVDLPFNVAAMYVEQAEVASGMLVVNSVDDWEALRPGSEMVLKAS